MARIGWIGAGTTGGQAGLSLTEARRGNKGDQRTVAGCEESPGLVPGIVRLAAQP